MEINWSELINKAAGVGIKIIIAIIVMIVSFKLIKHFAKKIEKKLLTVKHADKTLSKTLVYVGKVGLEIVVVICLIGYLGIDTTGISALIASLGVCVGLAVNGTLSNLAGGVMLLITRPFNVDDYIEVAGFAGTVEDIRIVSTVIRTPDNKRVYIPNGTLSGANIVNCSSLETRRVDTVFTVGHADDCQKAKEIILAVCGENPLVLKTPEPYAKVSKHGPANAEISARVWVKSADYNDVLLDLQDGVKKAFAEAGI